MMMVVAGVEIYIQGLKCLFFQYYEDNSIDDDDDDDDDDDGGYVKLLSDLHNRHATE